MQKAIDETARRREIQMAYNDKNGIVPKTVKKEIRDVIHGKEVINELSSYMTKSKKMDKKAKKVLIEDLEKEMKEAAKVLDFERAMELRDMIMEIKGEK